jgi:hypothetical protein
LSPAFDTLDVPNFHRVVVHGDASARVAQADDQPRSENTAGDTTFGPFSWEREIQP